MLNIPALERITQDRDNYQPENFLGREKELGEVAKRVEAGRSGGSIYMPLLNFWGVAGIGKSWLLRHIQYKHRFKPQDLTKGENPTFTLLFDFAEKSDPSSVIAQAAGSMARQLISQLGSALPPDAKSNLQQVDQSVSFLTNTINVLSRTFIPILLFDSIEQLGEAVRDELEVNVVEPVIWNDRVIVIVAGRRQIPRWKRFEVRQRAVDGANTEVMPFGRSQVRQQLGKWDLPAIADAVYGLSYGHPQTTDLLGQCLKQAAEKSQIDSQFLIRNRRELGDLLSRMEDHLLEKADPETRTALEIIAAPRYFGIETLRQFMTVFRGQEYAGKSDSYYLRTVIGGMEATNLVWWSRQHRTYIISDVVRRLINRRLNLLQHERFAELHRQALQMYLGWIAEYPKSASEFIIEALFHTAMLYQDQNAAELDAKLTERIENVKALSLEEANILCEQLQSDQEIEELLPPEVYNRFLTASRAIRDHKAQESMPAR